MKLKRYHVRVWISFGEDYTDMELDAQSEKAALALALKDAKRNWSTLFDGPSDPQFHAENIED